MPGLIWAGALGGPRPGPHRRGRDFSPPRHTGRSVNEMFRRSCPVIGVAGASARKVRRVFRDVEREATVLSARPDAARPSLKLQQDKKLVKMTKAVKRSGAHDSVGWRTARATEGPWLALARHWKSGFRRERAIRSAVIKQSRGGTILRAIAWGAEQGQPKNSGNTDSSRKFGKQALLQPGGICWFPRTEARGISARARRLFSGLADAGIVRGR